MPERLGKFDELISSGLHPSLPQDQVPLWADGENVIFKEKSVQPIPGQFLLLNKIDTGVPLGAIELEVAGVPNLFWGTKDKLFRFGKNDVPPDAVDVTGTSGPYTGVDDATTSQRATRWSLSQFGSTVMATNGQDTGQLWTGSNPFIDWTGLTWSTAEIIRTIGPFAIALNTDNKGQFGIEWCSADNLNLWTPATTNSAGNLIVRGMPSEIIAGEKLGDGLGIYATDGLWVMEFIGAPLFFRVRKLAAGLGAFGKDSVIPVGKIHYGCGPRGFFRTDGIAVQYMDDPSIHDFVYQNLNRAQASKIVGWNDSSLGTVNWSVPLNALDTDLTATVSFNYRDANWSKFGYVRTAAISGSVFDFIVTFDKFGNVYQHAVESFVPSDSAVPLQLTGAYTNRTGYGNLGYGQGGYGGQWVGIG